MNIIRRTREVVKEFRCSRRVKAASEKILRKLMIQQAKFACHYKPRVFMNSADL